jgi:hypothetical protein
MLRNAFEYLDRSTSFAAALALFVTIASRERPRFTVDHRRIFVFAGAWTISSADLSTRLLADPAALANATPDEIDDAFAGLLPDAQALVTGPP